jgi:hypothetical protein
LIYMMSAAAALFLLLAFAAPISALIGTMALGEIAAPTVAQRRARAIALLAVAAPPLFVFLSSCAMPPEGLTYPPAS